jgi:hypothetical protein
MSPGELIASYLKLRDKKRLLEEEHKKVLAPFNEALGKIELELARIMEETGLDNLPGGGGTAYRTIRSSVTVNDWDTFLAWVTSTGNWHMLEHRASKIAVEEVLDETQTLPPGLSINRAMTVNVRKA